MIYQTASMGCLLLSFNEISPDGQDPDWQEAINKPLLGRETLCNISSCLETVFWYGDRWGPEKALK